MVSPIIYLFPLHIEGIKVRLLQGVMWKYMYFGLIYMRLKLFNSTPVRRSNIHTTLSYSYS